MAKKRRSNGDHKVAVETEAAQNKPLSGWRLISGIAPTLAAGVLLTFIPLSLAFAGVIDMALAYATLALAWIVCAWTIVRTVRKWGAPRKSDKWKTGIAAMAVLTAVLGATGGYEYYYTQKNTEPASHIVIDKWFPLPPADKSGHFAFRAYFRNDGSLPTVQLRHGYHLAIRTDAVAADEYADKYIGHAHDLVTMSGIGESHIEPGQTVYWNLPPTGMPPKIDADHWQQVLDGKLVILIFGAIQYRDENCAEDEWRTTQYCVIVDAGSVSTCAKHFEIFASCE